MHKGHHLFIFLSIYYMAWSCAECQEIMLIGDCWCPPPPDLATSVQYSSCLGFQCKQVVEHKTLLFLFETFFNGL